MVKFGGKGTRRQCCKERECLVLKGTVILNNYFTYLYKGLVHSETLSSVTSAVAKRKDCQSFIKEKTCNKEQVSNILKKYVKLPG